MALCKARQPGGVLRCDGEKGHDRNGEDHWATSTSAGHVTRWSSRRGERVARIAQAAVTKVETSKQAFRRGRLAGITAERLAWQRFLFEQGFVLPAPPLSAYPPRPAPAESWCEWCGRATPPDRLALHHVIHRSLGARATEESAGDERPDGLGLICQGPGSCHDDEHPGPWAESEKGPDLNGLVEPRL